MEPWWLPAAGGTAEGWWPPLRRAELPAGWELRWVWTLQLQEPLMPCCSCGEPVQGEAVGEDGLVLWCTSPFPPRAILNPGLPAARLIPAVVPFRC